MVDRLIAELAEPVAKRELIAQAEALEEAIAFYERHDLERGWLIDRARQLRAQAEQPAAPIPHFDLDAEMWKAIKQAASESKWMPPQYMMNDWVSDLRRFLVEGPHVFEQPAEPVAWMVLHDGEFDYFVYANKHEADSAADINNTVATPLYARPDPCVAELEGLLREAKEWVPRHRQNSLYKRIEAALGEG